jgi:hypothetical protein
MTNLDHSRRSLLQWYQYILYEFYLSNLCDFAGTRFFHSENIPLVTKNETYRNWLLHNSYLFNEFVCKLGFFWYEWARLKREWNERFKGQKKSKKRPKKVQFTQKWVEYNVFLFDDPLKGSKSLKIFKINLTFRFDKLSHLSKFVHIGNNSQSLTVSNKNSYFYIFWQFLKYILMLYR